MKFTQLLVLSMEVVLLKRKSVTRMPEVTPTILMIYCFLPFIQYENVYALLFAIIGWVLSGIYIYRYRSSLLSICLYLIALIFLFLTYYQSIFFLVKIIALFIALFIVLLPFIIKIRYKESDWRTLLLYMITPLSFVIMTMIVALLIENNLRYLYFSESQYVSGLVFLWLLFTFGYSTRLTFTLYDYLLRERDKRSRGVYRIFVLTSIIIIFVFPDLSFSFMIYDLYLSLYSDETFRLFDIYYYNFSTHFLIPTTEVGESIKAHLIDTDLGVWIQIVHTITIRLIDITVLASVNNLLRQSN